MVTLIAEVNAKDGKEKEVESLFSGLIQEVEKKTENQKSNDTKK